MRAITASLQRRADPLQQRSGGEGAQQFVVAAAGLMGSGQYRIDDTQARGRADALGRSAGAGCQLCAARRRVLQRAYDGLGVPRIHFGVGTGELLGLMGEAGAEVVGVDWRVPLDGAVRRVGGRAVQGNLDPSLVLAPAEVMLAKAADVLGRGRSAPGHIFNLGHGVLPTSDPGQLARLTDFVHEHSAR